MPIDIVNEYYGGAKSPYANLGSATGGGGGGGTTPPTTPTTPLSSREMDEWNQFIRFVRGKGLSGSKELDRRDKNKGQELFNEFKAANPDTTITYDIVPRAQNEFLRFQQTNREFNKRRGIETNDQFERLSPQDGWFGSVTSQQELVPLRVQTKNAAGQVISSENKGLMSGEGIPQADLGSASYKGYVLPKGAETFKDSTGQWMVDLKDGTGEVYPIDRFKKK